MNKEMKDLREQLDHSSRQKDSLIVQLQQTLMLITQQQYSKMLNIRPKDEDGETVVVAVNDADSSGNIIVKDIHCTVYPDVVLFILIICIIYLVHISRLFAYFFLLFFPFHVTNILLYSVSTSSYD